MYENDMGDVGGESIGNGIGNLTLLSYLHLEIREIETRAAGG